MQRSGPWTLRRYCAQLGHYAPCGQVREISQLRRAFSTSGAPRNEDAKKEKNDGLFEINYFEQVSTGPEGIRPISKDKFEGRDEALEIKSRIQKLEEQLARLESPGGVEELSAADREKLKRAGIGLDGAEEDDTPVHKLFNGVTPKSLQLDFRLPEEHQRELHQLSSFLREVAIDPTNSRNRRLLWQQYILCKTRLPGVESQLPDGAWEVLWQSQYGAGSQDEARTRHLETLLEDMGKCGRELSPTQKVVSIEQRLAANRHSAALQMWTKWREGLQDDKDVGKSFLDLGPRLEAASGNTDKAQKLSFEIADRDTPRVTTFLPVFDAWLRRGDQLGSEKAWALYIRVRGITHKTITLEDYDKLSMCFMKHDQLELAVAVFKDLVLSGRKSQHDSREMYQKSLGMYHMLQCQATDSESVNGVGLMSLAVLPRSFQNKFFYASWMKRLIGLGQVDAAASILQLMYDRGVRPDPKHINGLVGAWFRRNRGNRGGDKDVAIKVCWAMIKKRLEFVALRHATHSDAPVPPIPDDPSTRIPPYLGNSLPAATVETFSLLLLYYSRAGMHGSIEVLNAALAASEIKPNVYYLTHLLYGHLRRGDLQTLWTLYTNASASVTPDLETVACLWDAEKAHITAFGTARAQKFPGPRSLLRHTLNWLAKLTPRNREQAKADFSADLYTQIIRCFSLTRDLEGTLVAIYALRDAFGAYPTADDVRVVTIQLARSGEASDFGWKRRRTTRYRDNMQSQANMTRVAELLALVGEERDGKLDAMGVRKAELRPDMQAEESLWVLGSFVRTVLEGRIKTKGRNEKGGGQGRGKKEEEEWAEGKKELHVDVDHEIERIAWDMDAGGLRMGSPLYRRGSRGLELVGFEGHEGNDDSLDAAELKTAAHAKAV